jgi:hypothetical protein
MPTTTWIQETVEDRFWESRGGGAPGLPQPPTYPCVVCGQAFDSIDERSWHASEAHPLVRPTLYVADHAAPAELIVRAPVNASLFSAESCTAVHVVLDGHPVDQIGPSGLGDLIAARRSGHLRIELENRRAADAADVRARYTLRISIPDDSELAAVDRSFVANLAVDRPSTRDVERFASEVEPFRSAREYAGALADYVHGVLVKEGTEVGGATLPFEAFQAKFSRALNELADHVDRPVAASVVAASRLNLNDLATPLPASGDTGLDGCARLLSEIVALDSSSSSVDHREGVAEVALCPIDRDTHLICTAYGTLILGDAADSRLSELGSRADDALLSPQDRAKLRTLVAVAALRLGHADLARRHLEVLAHDGVFGRWAESALEGDS